MTPLQSARARLPPIRLKCTWSTDVARHCSPGAAREALSEFLKAESGGLRSQEPLLHLGWSQLALGDVVSDAEYMRRACALAPENAVGIR